MTSYQVGFSEKIVTPKIGHPLAGYDVPRYSTTVHDELKARIVTFRGEADFMLLQLDLVGIDDVVIRHMQQAVAPLGFEPEGIFISASHTHSGPTGTMDTEAGYQKGLKQVFGDYDETYVSWIAAQVKAGAEEAIATEMPAEMAINRTKTEGICTNRNDPTWDYEEELVCIEWLRQDKKRLLIYDFSCHPTVMGSDNLAISGDFPNQVEQLLSEYDLVLFLNGSCGDISTRFTRQAANFAEVTRIAKRIVAAIRASSGNPTYEKLEKITAHEWHIPLKVKAFQALEELEQQVAQRRQELETAQREKRSAKVLRVIESRLEGATNLAKMATDFSGYQEIIAKVKGLQLNQLQLIYIPGELFSSLGKALKRQWPNCVIVGYGNGYIGYIPDRQAYQAETYESYSSPFAAGEGERLIQTISQKMERLGGRNTMITNDYLDFAIQKLQEVKETQADSIEEAAKLVAESCQKGGRFYVFGTGHSHIIAEEIYQRAGGLALVNAILEPEIMLHQKANKSTMIERLEGYAKIVFELNQIQKGDTLLVVSNSGRNAATVEMCLEAKAQGVHVIALCSLAHAQKVTSRHSSGKKIYELAEVTIDNCAAFGDAAFEIDGLDTPTGATSDITGTAIAQAIVTSAVDKMVRAGFTPPVFKSSNVDGADSYNQKLFDEFYRMSR